MPIANVTLNTTFDEWRLVTNQLSNYINDVDSSQLLVLGPSLANTARDQANTARIHANAAFLAANTARDGSNTAYEFANSGIIQANTARNHANVAYAAANSAALQADAARDHANAAFLAANTGIGLGLAYGQANTARDQANSAFSAANSASANSSTAAFAQANTARNHANVAFATANAALPNTSGVSFAGNLNFPVGNITIGEGMTKGIRLHVHSWSDTANVYPQIEAMSGSQFIGLNSNTTLGSWNDLMSNRDLSIIYSRGAADDGANLVIGPWTDSSFGYKQDSAGRHGFNTSNPRYTLDANGSANISGTIRSAGFYDSNNRLLLIKNSSGVVVWGT